MIRTWLGVALLAASWLFGLDYYAPANLGAWLVAVALGAALIDATHVPLPERPGGRLAAMAMLLVAAALMPWPYKIMALLSGMGLALMVAPIPRRWPHVVGRKAVLAGAVLAVQAVTLWLYAWHTARSHDLPGPLAWVLAWVVRALGADATTDGGSLAVHVAGRVHQLGATWDLLLDPATVGFLVGAIMVLVLTTPGNVGRRRNAWLARLRPAGVLAAATLAWLPLRAAMVLGLLFQRMLRADADVPLTVMNQFVTAWVPVVLLIGPVLLAGAVVRRKTAAAVEPEEECRPLTASRLATACAMVALGVGLLAVLWAWDPVGKPREGRIVVVERHSQWEPTTAPYDEDSYGESASYTYRVIYDYASRFFDMSRLMESDRIDFETLSPHDVVVLKTPTARFLPDEVAAIERFVRAGGGLLLVGDHTNVFRSTTYLNDVARRFGFTLRDDLLFCVGTPYEQPYQRPWAAHPAVEHVDRMDFAVSCSVDPGSSFGRAAIQRGGLWSLPAQYNIGNYHPPAEYRSEMRYGPFIQLWAVRHGRGRVLAFTDSTIFSNFCIFQPGKTELMLNMLQWLNHRSWWDHPWHWAMAVLVVGALGLGLAAGGVRAMHARPDGWVLVLGATVLGWTLGLSAVTVAGQASMPPPEPIRDGIDVVIDRTVSDVPLSKGAYTEGEGEGFGLLEQWIPRLGCFTSRRTMPDAADGDVLVVLHPTGSISPEYRDQVVRYVAQGGNLLVFDSPYNSASTAQGLLRPFGLSITPAATPGGEIQLDGKPSGVTVNTASRVDGGRVLATLDNAPVAARVAHGNGSVTAVGFAAALCDAQMGYHWMQEPDADLRHRYNLLYTLLRGVIDDVAER